MDPPGRAGVQLVQALVKVRSTAVSYAEIIKFTMARPTLEPVALPRFHPLFAHPLRPTPESVFSRSKWHEPFVLLPTPPPRPDERFAPRAGRFHEAPSFFLDEKA